MQTHQFSYKKNEWVGLEAVSPEKNNIQVVLVFAERTLLEQNEFISKLQSSFPVSKIITCSSAGEINHSLIQEESAVCSTMSFDKTPTDFSVKNIKDYSNSFSLGEAAAKGLKQENLKYILVISDGSLVNGDDLLKGIQQGTDPSVLISGGVAGDGTRFQKTLVGLDGDIKEGNVVLMGLYGDHIRVGSSAYGGWDIYGPERMITRSESNILYDIDGKNALELYKQYLGKYTEGLPASALLFPISIKAKNETAYVVRTILSIDETNKTMCFAGNVAEGSEVRFMKSNFDRLINAASDAGAEAISNMGDYPVDMALLVSCVGRKLVLTDRTDEEVEAVLDKMSDKSSVIGFFSYGEFAPQKGNEKTQLHNQTMTVTTFTELP